ncbi:MAG: hypothetical protein DYG89_37050 [Caldilinea sp. CFX5]|nr:hypothetical protein [Caldilinea sp. CFX5]
MSQIVIEDNLFVQLQRKARGSGTDIEELAHEAIQRYLQEDEQQKMQQEIAAFHDRHQELLRQFPGQYVAVHQGQVVDHDEEQLALYLRVRQRYPDEIVLIRQVRPEPERTWTMRTRQPADHWLATAGIFADDPTLLPMLDKIYAERDCE